MPLILAVPLKLTGSLFWMRMTVALFGIATVWFTYLLGARLIDEDAGLVGAMLLATNPRWSFLSAQAYSEVPSSCLVTLSLLLLVYARSTRWVFGAGLALVAATLVRYQAIGMLLPIGLVVLYQFERKDWLAFGAGVGLGLAVQAVHDVFVYGLLLTIQVDAIGKVGAYYPWYHYLRHAHHWLGYTGPVVLCLGGWALWRQGGRLGQLALVFPVALLFVVLSVRPHKDLRYLLTATPLAFVVCGAALHLIPGRSNWARTIPLVALLAVLPLVGTYKILAQDYRGFYLGQLEAIRHLEETEPGVSVATPVWSLGLVHLRGTVRVLDLDGTPWKTLAPKVDYLLANEGVLKRTQYTELMRRAKQARRFPSRNETFLLIRVR